MFNKNFATWFLFGIITLGLTLFCFFYPPQNFGGDIVEYHGITESLMKSGGINLTDEVASNLAQHLQPAYLEDPGYYITGRNDDRYPVHFIFYSLLALPVRLVLHLFQINELNTLRFTNLIILTTASVFIMRRFLPSSQSKLVYLLLIYLSPIIWFLLWPGPDLYYLMMLLIGIFSFFHKRYFWAALFTVLASWHSQPLIIVATAMIGYGLFVTLQHYFIERTAHNRHIVRNVLMYLGLMLLLGIPYAYNIYAFAMLTPWTILQDGWTRINGFGAHNMSFGKFFEQVFDLNVGLFWYAPVIVIVGFAMFIRQSTSNKTTLFLLIVMLVNAFFYQTNPAWHYGTAGYGPSRHAIFMLPFLVYFCLQFLHKSKAAILILILLIATQGAILHFNGYLAPNLLNTLQHSPYATFVLNNYPALYSPTPEIFVDRTNHQDITYPTSAIYTVNGKCKKAYVLITEKNRLEATCGSIPSQYQNAFDNPYLNKTNYKRELITIEATLWPDPGSCGNDYVPADLKAYRCLRTKDEAIEYLGIYDTDRIQNVDNLSGVWRVAQGAPVHITIPPGYIVHHYSFEGVYVNF